MLNNLSGKFIKVNNVLFQAVEVPCSSSSISTTLSKDILNNLLNDINDFIYQLFNIRTNLTSLINVEITNICVSGQKHTTGSSSYLYLLYNPLILLLFSYNYNGSGYGNYTPYIIIPVNINKIAFKQFLCSGGVSREQIPRLDLGLYFEIKQIEKYLTLTDEIVINSKYYMVYSIVHSNDTSSPDTKLLDLLFPFADEEEEKKLSGLKQSGKILLGNIWLNVFDKRFHIIVYDENHSITQEFGKNMIDHIILLRKQNEYFVLRSIC